jgi:hypothetical protein
MGPVSYETIELFSWPNPYSHTMTPQSTRPVTEISTRNRPGSKGQLNIRLAISLLSVSQVFGKCGSLDISQSYWPPRACYKDSFTFLPPLYN